MSSSSSVTAPTPQVVTNDHINQHVSKVAESLTIENRKIKLQLDEMLAEKKKLDDERLLFESERKQLDEKYKVINNQVERIKNEKRAHLKNVIDTDINPYLESIMKNNSDDVRLNESINLFKNSVNRDMDSGAFMDVEKESELRVIHAMASAGQVTSSKLDEIFQARKEWEVKMTKLKEEKDLQEKQMKEITDDKEKAIMELKRELEMIKSQKDKIQNTIKNVDSHFPGETPTPVDEEKFNTAVTSTTVMPVISAVASATPSGYNSIYAIQKKEWRHMYSGGAENVMGRLNNNTY
jgi:predicted  nucleic acid-binding Zn-ribbon protein